MIELLGENIASQESSRVLNASLCACRFRLSHEESSFSVEATHICVHCRHFFSSRGFAPSPTVHVLFSLFLDVQVQTGVCDANPYEGSCSCSRTILRKLSFSFARRSQNRSRAFTVMSLAELFLVGIYCTSIAQMSITSIGFLLLLLWPWVFLEFTALLSWLS